MRLLRKTGALLAAVLVLVSVLLPTALANAPTSETTILFTHDTHDHWLPLPDEDGGSYGGYARLSTLIHQQRAEHPDALVLDGGDFSMGSLFQTIYSTDAPELRVLGAMGYDAATLGNHEFDYRSQGLAKMLWAAVDSGDRLPALVQANYKPPASDKDTWDAWKDYGITDYTVIKKGSVNYGIFGLLGQDASDCAPMSGMEFEPIAEAAARVVKEMEEDLRSRNEPYFIICLSHSGTDPDPKKSEDQKLAEAVDGIDVIISGHTHSTTEEPIRVNDTLIVSCGPYTENLGVLTLSWKPTGEKTVTNFELIPVDGNVPEDPSISALAAQFKAKVEENYLADYGLTFDQVLAKSSFSFTPITTFGNTQEDDSLGNLIADSYVYAVKQAEGANYVPVDFAVVASGVVRASFAAGDITVSDAFNVSSLGSGGDGTPGYPLISAWVTGRELKDAFEVDASVTPLMPAAQLYPSGMTWTLNPHRMIFNKVISCAQIQEDGTEVPIEDDKLYRVVTGLYSGQMLSTVNGKSFGILTITPKDRNGNVIENMEDHIIHNQNGAEVKEWYALASYLQSLGNVPLEYAAEMNRKVVVDSWNPISLLKNPNLFTLLVLLAAVVLAALIVLIIRLVVRRVKGNPGQYSRRPYRGKRR
ncbi:MAG: bifunctional metallophosphatase/5'-nucleotidase [Oscillospiraceae bacterium]|nr:bifunctional metallophosphatase/5'-nucleotidase [Oscillospiraceae bacterium]